MALVSKNNNTAIQRVRDLHKPVQGPYDNVVCEECSHMDINVDFHTEYPCPTIKALDGEQIDSDRLIAINQQQDAYR